MCLLFGPQQLSAQDCGRPEPVLDISDATVCEGETIVLSDGSAQSADTIEYLLASGALLGSGNSLNFSQPAGSYEVYLRRTLNGCTDSTATSTLTVNALPTASFDFSTNGSPACSEVLVDLINNSSNSSGNSSGLTYAWDFGDGESSSASEPSHEFEAISFNNLSFTTQSFLVRLTVTDANGCTASTSQNVLVQEKPEVNWLTQDGTTIFASCATDKSSGLDTTEAAIYNSGDNAAVLQYIVDWNFESRIDTVGPGATGDDADTLRNVYIGEIAVDSFNIDLQAISQVNGCITTDQLVYAFDSRPNANIGGPGALNQSFDICIPSAVSFLNSSTNVSASTEVTFDFGDGSPILQLANGSMGDTVTHTFTSSNCMPDGGNEAFQVRLTVSNACGTVSQVDENVTLFAPPEAIFSVDSLHCPDETVRFSNESIPNYCSDDPRTDYLWDWGDGTDTLIRNVSPSGAQGDLEHTYDTAGTYTVTLTAFSAGSSAQSCGSSDTTMTIRVQAPPQGIFDVVSSTDSVRVDGSNPNMMFMASDPCIPVVLNLNDQSIGDDLSVSWSVSTNTGFAFGSTGGTGTSSDPTEVITFTSPGTYVITQTVSNGCGMHTCDVTVEVIGEPSAGSTEITCSPDFSPDPADPNLLIACEPALLDLGVNNTDTSITSWSWVVNDDLGNPIGNQPDSADTPDPEAITLGAGTYQVVLTVVNTCNTVDLTLDLVVQDAVSGGFDALSDSDSLRVDSSSDGDTLLLSDPCIPVILALNDASSGTNRTVDYAVDQSSGFSFLGSSLSNSDSISFSAAGVYTITQTVSNSCATESNSLVVVINEPPSALNTSLSISADFLQDSGIDTLYTACAPAILDLGVSNSDTTISTWAWTVTGTNGSPDPAAPTGDDTEDPGAITLGAGSYAVQLVATNVCASLTLGLALEVAEPPVATVAPTDTVCANESASLGMGSAVVGVSYSWTALDGGDAPDSPLSLNSTVSNSSGGNYLYQLIASAGQCADTATQRMVVNDLPVLDAGAADTAVCEGGALFTLPVTPSGGSWSGEGGITAAGDFDPGTAGSFNVSYSFTEPGTGCSNTVAKSITVNALPTVSAGPDITFCEVDLALTLNDDTSPTGGIWTTDSASTGLVDASGSYNPLTAGIGTEGLTYTFTDANGCSNSDALIVTVEALQTADAGADDIICRDSVLVLSGFSPANLGTGAGNWFSNDAELTLQNDTVVTASATGIYSLTYEYGEGVCLTSDTRSIEVVPLPDVFGGADLDTICIDEGILDLSLASGLTPATGGNWAGEGITDGSNGTFDPVIAAGADALPKTVSIFYTASLPNGCDSTYTRLLTINPLPQPAFDTLAVYCIDAEQTFVNTTPDIPGQTLSYEWDFGDGNRVAANADGSGTFTYSSPGTYTVQLFARSSQTCEQVTSREILVVEPAMPSFSVVPADSAGCAPLTVNFVNTTTGFEPGYTWDFGNGNSDTTASPGPQVYQSNIFGDTTYTVTLRTDNLCGSLQADTVIRVSPEPTVRFIAAENEICADFPLTFDNFSTGNPESFVWDWGDGSATETQDTTGLIDHGFPFEGTGDTTYVVTLTAFNACGSDTDSLEVTVNAKNVRAFFSVSDAEGCAPHTVTLTSNQTGTNTLIWNQGTAGAAAIFDSLSQTFTYTEPGTYMPSLEVRNGCDLDTFTTVITVLESPMASFTGAGTYCDGDTITLANTSSSSFGARWSLGDGSSFNGSAPDPFVYADSGSYTVSLTVRNPANNCPATATETITVNPTPVAAFTVSDSLCQFAIVQLRNNSVGADSYAWFPGDEGPLTDFEPAPRIWHCRRL